MKKPTPPVALHLQRDPGPSKLALFQLGFRPFFLLAGLWSAIGLTLWIGALLWGWGLPVYYTPMIWHAHEMLFGFAAAVVIGFLLTAARNWTGLETLKGAPLALLAGLWVAGRATPFLALPPLAIAIVELAFLPAAALAIAIPIVQARQRHNLVFAPLLLALFGADLLVHLDRLGVTTSTATTGLDLAVWLLVFLMALMGGRVIPFFIERGLGLTDPIPARRGLAGASLAAIAATAAADLADAPAAATALAAFVSALALSWRLARWHRQGVWGNPMLWVLYVGYAWLAIGLVLTALSAVNASAPQAGTHAFTAGALGTLTLGMMARVSLGHTGRQIAADGVLKAAFGLVSAAALVRVIGPLSLPPGAQMISLAVAAALWTGAFGLFFVRFLPILLTPRADGRPG